MFLLEIGSEASGTSVALEVEGSVVNSDSGPVGEGEGRRCCEFLEGARKVSL